MSHILEALQSRSQRETLSSSARRRVVENTLEDSLFLHKNYDTEAVPLPANVSSTISAATSSDGRFFASTHGDHTVKVFDAHTHAPLRVFEGHRRTPWNVKFNPKDSDFLASGCLAFEVRIWSISHNRCLRYLRFESPIISLSFHPEGRLLAVANGAKLHLWNWARDVSRLAALPACFTDDDEEDRERETAYARRHFPSSSSSSSSVFSFSESQFPLHSSPSLSVPITHDRNIRAVLFHPGGDHIFVAAPNAPRLESDPATFCCLFSVPLETFFEKEEEHTLKNDEGDEDNSKKGETTRSSQAWHHRHFVQQSVSWGESSPRTRQAVRLLSRSLLEVDADENGDDEEEEENIELIDEHALTSYPIVLAQVHLYSDGGIDVSSDGRFLLCAGRLLHREPPSSFLSLPHAHGAAFKPFSRWSALSQHEQEATGGTRLFRSHANRQRQRREALAEGEWSNQSHSMGFHRFFNNNNNNNNDYNDSNLFFRNNLSLPPTTPTQNNPLENRFNNSNNNDNNNNNNNSNANNQRTNSFSVREEENLMHRGFFDFLGISSSNRAPITLHGSTERERESEEEAQLMPLALEETNLEFLGHAHPSSLLPPQPLLSPPFARTQPSFFAEAEDVELSEDRDHSFKALHAARRFASAAQPPKRITSQQEPGSFGRVEEYELFPYESTLSPNSIPPGFTCEDCLIVYRVRMDKDTPFSLHTVKKLPPTLMPSVTSTRFSPTLRYAAMGFGVRDRERNVTVGHPEPFAVFDVVSLVDEALPTVLTLSSRQDEVNIVQFQSRPGEGLLYGTKKGTLRLLTRCIL